MATPKTSKSSKTSNEYGSGIANADVLKNKRAEAKRTTKRSPAVSIYLDERNHRRLKLASVYTNRPMADICREQVEKWLDAFENGEIETED